MEFTIDLYETSGGRAIVEEELESVATQMPVLHALLVAGLNKLRRREHHRPPLCMPIEGGLFEVRVGGSNIARALWFFLHGRRIVVVRCFVKKSQKTPRSEIILAKQRMQDYVTRYGP